MNITIGQLPEAASIESADIFPVEKAGANTAKVTFNTLTETIRDIVVDSIVVDNAITYYADENTIHLDTNTNTFSLKETYLPFSGGTLTGPLTLSRDPQGAKEAATKSYVDNKITGTASTNDSKYVNVAGDSMTGSLTVHGTVSGDRLLITQTGNVDAVIITKTTDTGVALRVNDESSDNTPFVITNNGRVGIKTASPNCDLTINGPVSTNNIIYTKKIAVTQSGNDNGITISHTGNSDAVTITKTTDTGVAFRVNDQSSDTTPFVIANNGNVGIGTTSTTDKKLVIYSPYTNNPFSITQAICSTAVNSEDGVQDGAYFRGTAQRENAARDRSAIKARDGIVGMVGYGFDGVGTQRGGDASIRAYAKENFTPTSHPTYMEFRTTASGTTESLTRIYIDDNGAVGIGTANPSDTYKLHVNGSIKYVGSVDTSDRRSKENIDYSFQYGLSTVNALKPVKFDYIDYGKNNLGFIAQDILDLAPELIVTSLEEISGVLEERHGLKANSISPILVKAIQELSQKVDAQAQEIKDLKSRISSIST